VATGKYDRYHRAFDGSYSMRARHTKWDRSGFTSPYPLLPWTGIMLVGYAAVQSLSVPAKLRDSRLICVGSALVIGFGFYSELSAYTEIQVRGACPGQSVGLRHVIPCHDEVPTQYPVLP